MSGALYLPDWTVLKVDDGNGYVVQASYDIEPASCAKCGVISQLYRHGAKSPRYRDAPVHGKQTIIEVKRARYLCRACSATFMQALPDMDDDRRMTHRCRDYIAEQYFLKPNTGISKDVGVDEKVVRQIGKENSGRLFAIRTHTLFGKRRGRINKSEFAARANLAQCWSCKALFESDTLEKVHLVPVSAGGSLDRNNLARMCPTCHRLGTGRWFNHSSVHTLKSE